MESEETEIARTMGHDKLSIDIRTLLARSVVEYKYKLQYNLIRLHFQLQKHSLFGGAIH